MGTPRGLYTPVYQSVVHHPKTVEAAGLLHCDRQRMIGHLVTLWTYCLAALPTSDHQLSAKQVALAAEWPPKQAEKFAQVLADVGFLDRVGEKYTIHDWPEYGGKIAARQMADRERKRIPSEPRRNSSAVPQEYGGNPQAIQRNSIADETRQEEKRQEASLSDLISEQDSLLEHLHAETRRRLSGGRAMMIPTTWGDDLIRRDPSREYIDHAVEQSQGKSKAYVLGVLKRLLDDRDTGHEPSLGGDGAGDPFGGVHISNVPPELRNTKLVEHRG